MVFCEILNDENAESKYSCKLHATSYTQIQIQSKAKSE